MKNKRYKLLYSFNGMGEAIVKAKDKAEAEKMFFDTPLNNKYEWWEDYDLESITEIEN